MNEPPVFMLAVMAGDSKMPRIFCEPALAVCQRSDVPAHVGYGLLRLAGG